MSHLIFFCPRWRGMFINSLGVGRKKLFLRCVLDLTVSPRWWWNGFIVFPEDKVLRRCGSSEGNGGVLVTDGRMNGDWMNDVKKPTRLTD